VNYKFDFDYHLGPLPALNEYGVASNISNPDTGVPGRHIALGRAQRPENAYQMNGILPRSSFCICPLYAFGPTTGSPELNTTELPKSLRLNFVVENRSEVAIHIKARLVYLAKTRHHARLIADMAPVAMKTMVRAFLVERSAIRSARSGQ